MATLAEWKAKNQITDTGGGDSMEWFGGEDAGWARSMAAAIPSGFLKIFEGAATLGAALLDLGVDKDRVEAVEQYFADINPFDEAAAATGIGKITELIVNIGVPGGLAFKAASGLGKATIAAQKAGKYIKPAEKARRFGQGMLGAGAAEGIFVGDVEDAGTFGDWLGGPTQLERDADAELLNRIKFGIEGAAFTGAFGAAAKLVGKMRGAAGTSKAITGKTDIQRTFNKGVDRLSSWFRSRGMLPQEGYDIHMKRVGAEAKDTLVAETAMRDIDSIADRITKGYKKVAVDKIDKKVVKDDILKEMNDVLMSGSATNGKIKPLFGFVDEFKIDPKTGRPGTDPKFKTGKQLYNVEIDSMDPKKVASLRKLLKEKYKASPEDINDLLGHFVTMRGKWGELFTSMGRRLNVDGVKQFEEMLPKYLNDVLDRGYDVFKNNRGQLTVAKNYPPTKAVITEAIKDFKRVAALKGLELSDELAEQMVGEVWRGATLTPGFKLGVREPAQVRFKSLPDFMQQSLVNKNVKVWEQSSSNLAELTGVAKPIIQKLLG